MKKLLSNILKYEFIKINFGQFLWFARNYHYWNKSLERKDKFVTSLKTFFNKDLQEWRQLLPAAFKADEFSTYNKNDH